METAISGGIWSVGMGAVSLFPLLGRLQRLNGFYPDGFKSWFITISSIFSLAVYLAVHWYFGNLPFYLPVPVAFATAVTTLFVYVFGHLYFRGHYGGLPRAGLAAVIVSSLIVYTIAIGSLTYLFNSLERAREFSILYGLVRVTGTEDRVAGAEIDFHLNEGRVAHTSTHDFPSGYFSVVFPKDTAKGLSAIRAQWENPTGTIFGATAAGKDYREGGFLVLRLVEFPR